MVSVFQDKDDVLFMDLRENVPHLVHQNFNDNAECLWLAPVLWQVILLQQYSISFNGDKTAMNL